MSTPGPPNVSVIVSDQHRWDCLQGSANAEVATPNLHALARDGTTYDNAFCAFPVCTPSRYSLLSSLYAHQHTAGDNGATLPSGTVTFPDRLRRLGYTTAAVGKMHFRPTYLDVGFDTMVLAEQHGPGRYADDYHRYLRDRGLYDRVDLWDQVPEYRARAPREYWESFGALPSDLSEKDYSSTWIADRAIEQIDGWNGAANLLMVSFIKPHHPFDPPKPWDARYDPNSTSVLPGWTESVPELDARRGGGYFPNARLTDRAMRRITAFYYATISHMDHQIGRIVDALRRRGYYDDAMVVYCSDHGELMGFHHMILKHNYMYEPLVRVPLIVKRPGEVAVERHSDNLVSLIDLAPTIVAQAGGSVPTAFTGRALDSPNPRRYVFAESYDEKMIRTSRYKLLYMREVDQRQLFDLQKDPMELNNLYEEAAGVRRDLEQLLFDEVLFGAGSHVHRDSSAPTSPTSNAVVESDATHASQESYFRRRMAQLSPPDGRERS